MEKDKHLGLRIDSDTHRKLKSMAEYNGRSINGEVLYLIRQAISEYEKRHGELEIIAKIYMEEIVLNVATVKKKLYTKRSLLC